jgi:eukaryotic-like serine/threonine-protein kinase
VSCPSPDDLHAYSKGSLAADARGALQAHLMSCETCCSGLQQLDDQLASPGAPFSPSADVTRTLSPGVWDLPSAEQASPVPQVQRIGPYILLEQLGAGAVGSVYAAYHPQLDRQVAVKLLHSDGASDRQAPERLLREAQALARLSHPHVVAVHDAGTWEGRVFMVMEQVPGTDLRAWLKEKPRTWREVRDVFVQAGEGLAAAHAAGLVHRDFKPPNVLVGKDGRIRVADFGLARAAQGLEARSEERTFTPGGAVRVDTTLTQAGFAVGTLAYMAPEQLSGHPADARSDQFAFCVSLWEALYGKRPWSETIPGTPRGSRVEPAEKRDVPPFFRALLDRGLAEEPAQRFPSMDALLDALREDPETKWRRRAVGIGVAAAVVAVVSLGSLGVLRQRNAAARVCERPVSAFAGTWDKTVRGRLRTAFAATHVAWAAETFGRVERALDTYVEEWGQLDRRLCEDTLVHRTQSEQTRRQQSACLERRRGEVEALVTLLGQVDAKMVDRAVSATAGLSTPKACANMKQLAHEPPGPMHLHNAQAVTDWRKALQQAKAQVLLGRYTGAETTAQSVVSKAEEAEEPAIAAAGFLVTALVRMRMGRDNESVAFAKRAFNAALAGRDDVAAFYAANETGASLARLGKTEEAREWVAIFEGLLERLGATPELSHSAAITRVILATESQNLDSITLADEAVVTGKLAFGENDVKTHTALVAQAMAYGVAGRLEEAAILGRKLVTVFESTYGESSPMLVHPLINLGTDLQSVGHLDEALAVHQRADALAVTTFGESGDLALNESVNLSFILRKLGRAQEAYPRLVKVIEATRAMEDGTPLLGSALAQLGWLEFVRGDVKAARRAWEQSRALFAEAGEGLEGFQKEFEDGLGQLELAAGRSSQAIAHLEKALTLREESKYPVDDTALTRLALAQALAATPHGLARAKELLEKAEQELEGFSFRQRELEHVKALRTQLDRLASRLDAAHRPKP